MKYFKKFDLGFIIFAILIFIFLTDFNDLRPLHSLLHIEYKDYFLFKKNNSLSDVYNKYTKLSDVEKVSLNLIDGVYYEPIILGYSTKYTNEYFNITNKKYDSGFVESVSTKTTYYIDHYRYYVMLIEFIKYCVFLSLICYTINFIDDFINKKVKCKKKNP